MASLTIRQLDDDVKRRLRLRAARHGRSMEEEARHLLALHLAADPAATATPQRPIADFWETAFRNVGLTARAFENEEFEVCAVVVGRHTPLPIVILAHKLIVDIDPGTAFPFCLRHAFLTTLEKDIVLHTRAGHEAADDCGR